MLLYIIFFGLDYLERLFATVPKSKVHSCGVWSYHEPILETEPGLAGWEEIGRNRLSPFPADRTLEVDFVPLYSEFQPRPPAVRITLS